MIMKKEIVAQLEPCVVYGIDKDKKILTICDPIGEDHTASFDEVRENDLKNIVQGSMVILHYFYIVDNDGNKEAKTEVELIDKDFSRRTLIGKSHYIIYRVEADKKQFYSVMTVDGSIELHDFMEVSDCDQDKIKVKTSFNVFYYVVDKVDGSRARTAEVVFDDN